MFKRFLCYIGFHFPGMGNWKDDFDYYVQTRVCSTCGKRELRDDRF